MTDLEYKDKLARAHREAHPRKPGLRLCWCCGRHTGTKIYRYAGEVCAKCGAQRREP